MKLLFAACIATVACQTTVGSGSNDARSDGMTGSGDGNALADAFVNPGGELDKANLFFTGHSLLDNPLPDYVEGIVPSMDKLMRWNQQNVVGSPLRGRTRGDNPSDPTFAGYRTGKNRETQNMDVVAELRAPQTLGGESYDALVMTERHDLASVIQWEDTVRYARHYHERFVAGNANGQTYFYAPWASVDNMSDPTAWIAYERAAHEIWQCVPERINVALALEGRSDRVRLLPASLALLTLVERATQGNVPGITAGSTGETMARLFNDTVHMRPVGAYYLSLVVYASVFRASPIGAWAPPEVSAEQAASLQAIAWDVVAAYYANPPAVDLAACRDLLANSMCATYWTYWGSPQHAGGCRDHFSSQTEGNPFYFDPAGNNSYWFPPPL